MEVHLNTLQQPHSWRGHSNKDLRSDSGTDLPSPEIFQLARVERRASILFGTGTWLGVRLIFSPTVLQEGVDY